VWHGLRVLSVVAMLAASAAVGDLAVARPGVTWPPADTVTRYYTMRARVRPLLFWITKDRVGAARISWNRSPGPDQLVELLVGSDPDRAPMGINHWGFVAERTFGATTHLVGVMTETDDRAIDAARGNPNAVRRSGREFKTIRATVQNREATSAVGRVVFDKNLTYRHYAALLERLPDVDARVHRLETAPGTAPGFLTALKALVHESVEKFRRTPGTPPCAGLRRNYVYTGTMYQLTLGGATLVPRLVVGNRRFGPTIQGQFEIRNLNTGGVTTFEMTYGVQGDESETPVRIAYRPRWWVELELLLLDGSEATMAAAMAPHTMPVAR
jgi:hypothetical protein